MSRQVHGGYSYQRLRDYALWYYFRYYPSDAKLLKKLSEKGKREDAEKVFGEIQHMLQEDEIIASKIEGYIAKNKNYLYIKQKMFEKLFPKQKVEAYLQTYKDTGESMLDTDFLKNKITHMYRRGKSTLYIGQKLAETPQDREKIQTIIQSDFPQGEQESLEIAYNKLLKHPQTTIIQKLMAQGFRYSDIQRVLSGSEEA